MDLSSPRRWYYATAVLCAYGFFKQMKPSEPFLNPYLTSPTYKNFTNEETDGQIYPYWTYSYMIALVFVLLFTDFLLYRPVILMEAIAYLMTRILLIWGSSLVSMQFMQVAYGIATATEVAYYSYVYSVVSETHYKKVTSMTRMAVLLGNTIGWYMGQIIYDRNVSLLILNYISFGSIILAAVIALFLPPVPTRERHLLPEFRACGTRFRATMRALARDFARIYSNRNLLRWSLWWAFATCGEFQLGNYVQNLWSDINAKEDWNGYAQATATLAGFFVALGVAFLRVNWSVWGELLLGVISLIDAATILVMNNTANIFLAYAMFIVFRASYTFLITVATYQIALYIGIQRYGLVFGTNMFLALAMQSLLTYILIQDSGPLHVSLRTQFDVICVYFYLIGMIFTGMGVYRLTRVGWANSLKMYLWTAKEKNDSEVARSNDEPDEPFSSDEPINNVV